MLVTATTPMSCCSSTALQNCRSAAQQPCSQTCACPLQHCCCQWQGGNSLAHHCNYTYELLQFYSPAEVQHSNHAHKPVHALCSTAAVSGKVATALLIIATTIMCCCSSYSPAELQKCSTATMPTNLCMPFAALLLSVARWQQPCSSLQLQLCVAAVLQPCRTAEVQHSNHAQKPVHPFAALLLSVARWQQPCLSLQLHLGDFAFHTALQNCRSAAQQPCPQTCACPLQHCCCQWQGGNSLAHHCNYTYESLQFYSPAEVQHSNLA